MEYSLLWAEKIPILPQMWAEAIMLEVVLSDWVLGKESGQMKQMVPMTPRAYPRVLEIR
jgi:hypothetical protein